MMKNRVPDIDIIDYVLNAHFQDTPAGGWAEETENGDIYIYNPNGSLYALIPCDMCFELLNNEEEVKNEIKSTQ